MTDANPHNNTTPATCEDSRCIEWRAVARRQAFREAAEMVERGMGQLWLPWLECLVAELRAKGEA